jgi:DNA-binding LacI/PurR family transcriptional regulator
VKKRIRIGDVAAAAGVSTTTVSRVMSGTGRISALTRERVFAVIERLEYQPSAIAKGLIESKTYNIGVVLSPDSRFENNFLETLLKGAISILNRFSYDVVISGGDESDGKSLEKFIKRQKVEGLLLTRSLSDGKNIRKLKQMGFPFVVVGSPSAPGAPYADIDYSRAISELIKKLSERSENRIVFIANDENLFGNILKANEFKKQGFGAYIGNDFFAKQMFLDFFIKQNNKNKSVVTADYDSLLFLINYARVNNLKIPDDIQTATFGEYNFPFYPAVTSVPEPAFTLGEKAALILMNIIKKGDAGENFVIESPIIFRESTL